LFEQKTNFINDQYKRNHKVVQVKTQKYKWKQQAPILFFFDKNKHQYLTIIDDTSHLVFIQFQYQLVRFIFLCLFESDTNQHINFYWIWTL